MRKILQFFGFFRIYEVKIHMQIGDISMNVEARSDRLEDIGPMLSIGLEASRIDHETNPRSM